MKNNILEDAKQWVRDLLYENGVHQRDAYIFDNAENELETFLEKMRQKEQDKWENKTIIIPKGKTHPVHDICEDCFERGKEAATEEVLS